MSCSDDAHLLERQMWSIGKEAAGKRTDNNGE